MFFPHNKSFPEMLRLGVEPYIKEGDALAGVELSNFARHIVKHQIREVRILRTDLKSDQDLNTEYVIRSRIPVYAPEPTGDIGSMEGYKGPTNQAVHGLVGSSGTIHAQWKGDILIAKRLNRRVTSVELLDEVPGWEDLTPGDAKILKDLFMEYGNEDLDRAFPKARKTAPGLKMTCEETNVHLAKCCSSQSTFLSIILFGSRSQPRFLNESAFQCTCEGTRRITSGCMKVSHSLNL